MPDLAGAVMREPVLGEPVLASLAGLAAGASSKAGRVAAAADLLCLARRAAELLRTGELVPAAEGAEAALVTRCAEAWDPAILTAREVLEGMAPAELDALLLAAPVWAGGLLAANPAELRLRAA